MSNTYTLPDDICRCLDSACPRHDQCLRWLTRKDSRLPHGPSYSDSLRYEGECRSFMSVEPDAPFCGCGD